MKDLNEVCKTIDRKLTVEDFLRTSEVVARPGASIVASGAQHVTMDSPAAAVAQLYYIPGRREYAFPTSDGRYTRVDRESAKVYLNLNGVHRAKMDEALYNVQLNRSVDYVGPLSGYMRGYYVLADGTRVLVDRSPEWIKEEPASWDATRMGLFRFFGRWESDVETFHLCAWLGLRRLYISGRMTEYPQAPALIFVGPRGLGKNFVQECIITPLLGGRSADPLPFLDGKTRFSDDIMAAEHLLIADGQRS
jgi:hypothetical protein